MSLHLSILHERQNGARSHSQNRGYLQTGIKSELVRVLCDWFYFTGFRLKCDFSTSSMPWLNLAEIKTIITCAIVTILASACTN